MRLNPGHSRIGPALWRRSWKVVEEVVFLHSQQAEGVPQLLHPDAGYSVRIAFEIGRTDHFAHLPAGGGHHNHPTTASHRKGEYSPCEQGLVVRMGIDSEHRPAFDCLPRRG